MWYVFPQIDGLGSSAMSRRYAIKSLAAVEIFGPTDQLKLRSCATLFAEASTEGSLFHRLLEKYFQGEKDPATLPLLC
jgi:uncharacterized protein (DUF1810 family)